MSLLIFRFVAVFWANLDDRRINCFGSLLCILSGNPMPNSTTDFKNVLVVNQHGDNRGDEAALRAMMDGVESRLGSTHFTVLHQYRNRQGSLDVPQSVDWISLVLPLTEALRLVCFVVLGLTRAHPYRILGTHGRKIIDAYEGADVVVSAPGGPYLGDIYSDHEPLHWLYIWLSRLYGKPIVLYATSVGPFRIRWRRAFRRYTFRCFDRVIVREERSAGYLRDLLGNSVKIEVTADSAMQHMVEPLSKDKWVALDKGKHDRRVLMVSAFDGKYSKDQNSEEKRDVYDKAIVAAVTHIADGHEWHVVFVPQLHDSPHRDAPYLERLAGSLPASVSSEVLDDQLNSYEQRQRFASADLVLAGRYHPAVFAVAAEVPVLCIPYEHKAAGLMEAAGLDEYIVPIEEVTTERLVEAISRVWKDRETVVRQMAKTSPKLRKLSGETSDAVQDLFGQN
jgi:colanic acid/amylovoran biosynthesis protein